MQYPFTARLRAVERSTLLAAPAAVFFVAALGDLEGPWRLGVGAALGIVALGLALGAGASLATRFVLANLVLLGLLLWAAAERETLDIQLSRTGLDVRAGQTQIHTEAVPDAREVTVQLAEQVARRASQAPLLEPLPDLTRRLLLWPQANLLAGVGHREVVGRPRVPADEAPLWQELQEDRERWHVVGSLDTADARIRLELLRPSTMVRVLLGRSVPASGLLVEVRPENRWLLLAEMRDGRIVRELAGGEFAYRPTLDGASRRLIREVARSWLWGLLLLALGLLAAGCWPRPVRLPTIPIRTSLGLVILVALAVTAFVACVVYEGIPHVTDSAAFLFQARTFALGRLWAPAPPLPEFFDHQHLILQEGRWFSKYPPGAALSLLPGAVIGAPWLSGPVLAALTVLLTYEVGRQAYGPRTAALAAGLLVLSPFFLFMSGSMMAHPFALLLTMAGLAAGVRAGRGEDWPALACGLALGLLAMTRPLTALGLAATLGSWIVVERDARPRSSISVGLRIGAGALPPVLGWLLYNWALVGNPLQNTMLLYWPFDRPGFGPDVGNLGGHDLERGLANLWINVLEANSHLFGWPVYLTLSLPILALLQSDRRREDWLLAGVALCTSCAYILWWFPGTIHGPRYVYEAVGVLALLAARGFSGLAAPQWQAGWRGTLPFGSLLTAVAVAVILLTHNLLLYLPEEFPSHRGYNGIDRSRLNAVERAGLRDAVVFVSDSQSGWQAYSSVFPANSPLLDGPVIYAHDLGEARNRELLSQLSGRRGYTLSGGRLRPMP